MSSPGGPQQPYPNDQFGQQGGFPPPGGQPGGGFPPPGGQPAGGFPPPGGQGGFPPPGSAPQPARRGGAGRLIVILVVALVVIGGLIAAGIYFNRDAASNAKVGDCVQQSSGDDIKVVKCDDANADYKVVGRVEDKSQAETRSACASFPDAESAYWEGKPGENGLVLCLAPIK